MDGIELVERIEAAYDEGYKAAQEDCAPPNVWVICFDDEWAPDGTGSINQFHSIVGSEFAAQETIDHLNELRPRGRYYFKEVFIEAV